MKKSASVRDTLSTPSVNAGKPVNEWVSLSDQKATPVGRPTTDMARVAGMVSRGTARPGQVQAAQMMSQAANQERGMAAMEKYYSKKDSPPETSPLATAAGAMGVAVPETREGNIAAARKAGTFDATRDAYNTKAAASGQYMDAQGTIGSAPLPAAPAPQGIGSAMGGQPPPPQGIGGAMNGSVVAPVKKKSTDLTGSWGELPAYSPLGNAANKMGVNSLAPKY